MQVNAIFGLTEDFLKDGRDELKRNIIYSHQSCTPSPSYADSNVYIIYAMHVQLNIETEVPVIILIEHSPLTHTAWYNHLITRFFK